MNAAYAHRIEQAREAISDADHIIIGAGAGLSDAAGLKYSGKRFTDHFQPFIDKYHFTDLYTSSFYPFQSDEECWAYWAKHISLNRYETPATPLYIDLLKLVESKDHFVITTNVESQFHKAGFRDDRIFAVQGDYGLLQCASACHNTLYHNEAMVAEMLAHTVDCKIPSHLVPVCPVCGGKMDVNLRKDGYFVEDDNWAMASQRYHDFTKKATRNKLVLLELGVGYNTPGIIRYPFEQITFHNSLVTLIRINTHHWQGATENRDKTIAFNEDMAQTINELNETDARHLESMARVHKNQ